MGTTPDQPLVTVARKPAVVDAQKKTGINTNPSRTVARQHTAIPLG